MWHIRPEPHTWPCVLPVCPPRCPLLGLLRDWVPPCPHGPPCPHCGCGQMRSSGWTVLPDVPCCCKPEQVKESWHEIDSLGTLRGKKKKPLVFVLSSHMKPLSAHYRSSPWDCILSHRRHCTLSWETPTRSVTLILWLIDTVQTDETTRNREIYLVMKHWKVS